ncbi:MAG TPA: tripartite tricarboxylate transporter substrate binding protein [Ramlibacter sp.]|nr:tripartite tricarboxylate transporter substrate binding protein [Ramlibacter sp.]
MTRWFQRTLAALMSLGMLTAGLNVRAQEYPARLVKLVVASSAGTQFDAVTRVVGDELAKLTGKPVIVENRPGAEQVVGIEYVLGQPADGHTLFVASTTSLVTMPLLLKNLRFDPLKDLTPVALLVSGRLVVGSSAQHPWKTFDEFVKAVREKPGQFNYGSVSTTSQLATASFLYAPKLMLDMTPVPYTNTASYVQGLVGTDVHVGLLTEQVASSLRGRFNPLAVTGSSRMPSQPQVPTLEELGVPEVKGNTYVLFVKSGTPRPVVDRINALTTQVMRSSEVKSRFEGMRLEVVPDTSVATAAREVQREAQRNAEVARKLNLQPK